MADAGQPSEGAEQARALLDRVLRGYGLRPEAQADPEGFRAIEVEGLQEYAAVLKGDGESYHLVILTPLLQVPDDGLQLAPFFRQLLTLHYGVGVTARFALAEGVLCVFASRPIRGLDAQEVDDALRGVLELAGAYREPLQQMLEAALKVQTVAPEELPDIRMTPREAARIGATLARCSPWERTIFRYILERWQRSGGELEPGDGSIGLQSALGAAHLGLAALMPPAGEHLARIGLAWHSLMEMGAFPPESVARYQARVQQIAPVTITENTAHLTISEALTREKANTLLRAIASLAATGHEPPPRRAFAWPEGVLRPRIALGERTLAGMALTLAPCSPTVQALYGRLIEGWAEAGGTVRCLKAGRIYLKLAVAERDGDEGGLGHEITLATLAAPAGKKPAAIEVAWNQATNPTGALRPWPEAAAGWEAAVATLPGFEARKTAHRLVLGEGWGMAQAEELLGAMISLKNAAAGT